MHEHPQSRSGGSGAWPRFLSVAALAAAAGLAHAQAPYPTRTIRIIVADTPAGTTDILARAIGHKFTETWKQPVIVDNRPGGNGNIGTAAAAKAPADGHTLLMGTTGTHGVNPGLYPKLQFDAVRDFAPVILAAIVPKILVVHNALPAKNLQDLIAHAKKNPRTLSFGSAGAASAGHLSAELFKSLAGIDMAHVAYKGGTPLLQSLLGGQVQVVIDDIPPYLPHVQAGRIRALAVTAAKRSPAAPQLPTMAEAGLKAYEATAWFGLFAPAGTPAEVIEKLAEETRRILELPDVRSRLHGLGAQPAGGTPEEFASFVESEIAKWGKVIRSAGLTAQ